MSTPRRGVRRGRPQRRTGAARPEASTPPPARPSAPEPVAVAPATPATLPGESGPRRWLLVLDWGAWILLWVSAAGAGYFLGRIDIAKALFIAVMLAVTVLPWLRWIRPGRRSELAPSRVAMLHGVLAIFVALVLVLSGTYWWALPLVVVQLALGIVILVKTDRPAEQT